MKNKLNDTADQLSDKELLDALKERFEQKNVALSELRTLMEQLKNVNTKLAESEALKSHFISNITNEIINPFTSILGLSKSILAIKEGDWHKVKSMASLIHSEAFSLDFQLKNIFAAAEIEAGESTPQILNVKITELIKNVIESFEPEAEKKQIEITNIDNISKIAGDFTFKTDPEKIQIMLANLIDNAIKFSSAASKVEVKSWLDDGLLKLSVKDYGIGISPENQKIIFDRFKRLDTGINSINRGHGLGLSINRAFLDLLNGTIDVESQKKQGAYFIITLPEFTQQSQDYAEDGNEIFFGNDEIF